MKSKYSVGKSGFVPWNDLDKKARYFALDYFGYDADAYVSRDETSLYLSFTLREESRKDFEILLKQYDREDEYDVDEEFEHNGETLLPELPSLRLLGLLLKDDLGFLPRAVAAFEGGVFFYELPVGYDCCSDYAERNTRVNFVYRDGDNYKFPQSVVVKGAISDAQISEIFSCLDSDGRFIPGKVGLPCAYANPFERNEADHDYCELDKGYAFVETSAAAEVEMTVGELVEKFKEKKDAWENA